MRLVSGLLLLVSWSAAESSAEEPDPAVAEPDPAVAEPDPAVAEPDPAVAESTPLVGGGEVGIPARFHITDYSGFAIRPGMSAREVNEIATAVDLAGRFSHEGEVFTPVGYFHANQAGGAVWYDVVFRGDDQALLSGEAVVWLVAQLPVDADGWPNRPAALSPTPSTSP